MPNPQNALKGYTKALAESAGVEVVGGEVLAKVLTSNDDAGRHGVLIPSEGYDFFPYLHIPDPSQNFTREFDAFFRGSSIPKQLAYKYYQRYPERRITRLPSILNDRFRGKRLVIFLAAKTRNPEGKFIVDAALEAEGYKFPELFGLCFGKGLVAEEGMFSRQSIEVEVEFRIDAPLAELLQRFDDVKGRGWIESLRRGDTGIGYTFETLLGIRENNLQIADFKGIEIKCKQKKSSGQGKINLFQQAPTWTFGRSMRERLTELGIPGPEGLYRLHSQVTVQPNNLGLRLFLNSAKNNIKLEKHSTEVGYWLYSRLEQRLMEKHSRAAFVKASIQTAPDATQFRYEELVYCEGPKFDRFLNLVRDRKVVVEFLMYEKPNGSVRDRGIPWRLISDTFLNQLFAFQIQLR